MYKHVVSLAFFCFLFSNFIGQFLPFDEYQFTKREQRRPTIPTWPVHLNHKSLTSFLNNVDKSMGERLPFREIFMNFYFLHPHAGKLTPVDLTSAYIEGKEGWLFLGNPYNNVLSSTKNNVPPTKQDVVPILDYIKKIRLLCEKFGIQSVVLIAPNKHSVYEEYLPAWVTPTKNNSQNRLADLLLKQGRIEKEPVVFPRMELLSEKNEGDVYYSQDTHWNIRGAWVGLKSVLKLLSVQGVPTEPVFRIAENRLGGDLATMRGTALRADPVWEILWNGIRISPVSANHPIHEWETPDALYNKKILIIGDSFSEALAPLIGHFFSHTIWVREGNNRYKIFELVKFIEKYKPDIIVLEKVERGILDDLV